MIVGTGSERLAEQFGQRIACLVGDGLLAAAPLGMAWTVGHGDPAIAACVLAATAVAAAAIACA